ncbi:PAS domain S-box protein [Halobaculum litoreum]|uniref:PAS domain S-box protein n=1 Tax=Halobaculum litoreum TaxID=3031998 RepID=UPI0024C2DE5D|nr:PAS domain S-box protein [Halobaculum sp. DT92]
MDAGGLAESILDHIQDKVALVDGDGVVVDVNAAVVETLGVDRESYVGENAFDHIHSEDVDRVATVFDAVRDGAPDADDTVTYRHATGDDGWVWLESRIAPLDGRDDTFVVSSRDISARVEAERREARTESLLAELARTTSDVLWTFTGDWGGAVVPQRGVRGGCTGCRPTRSSGPRPRSWRRSPPRTATASATGWPG